MKTLIIYFAAVLTANVVPLGAQVSECTQKIHDEALVFDAHVTSLIANWLREALLEPLTRMDK